ncbi:MAG: methyltransferase [Anaerosolibacter sp.]|jgi:putative AdoMet-dependent methyltransferase|uniref:MerR family transcriptional regulator n=1 Tax=Anaerosolibacter sp. TaxID=1872527 RepID=UPI00262FA649|nr:MerR family transcriptional regulator [Anaerosolibacter sp.]MDF2545475.1 methyltransferase [Anaerosolibacter sp.]
MERKYTINEVAQMFQITTNKIRFYEKKNILHPQRDMENNYRYFTEDDIIKLQAVLVYRMMNIPIEQVKDMMVHYERENIINHFHSQWKYINDEIHRLQLIQNCLEGMMDTVYDCPALLGDSLPEQLLPFAQNMNNLYQIKNSWKDRWNFDDWATSYDVSVKNNIGRLGIYKNYERILDTVFDQSIKDKAPHSKILEIGVGTGNLAKRYLTSAFEFIGIDQSREMLNVAKQKFPNLRLRIGEFLKIPYPNNYFDIIVSTYAFHHLTDEEKEIAVAEMVRVLRKDGRIVLGDLMFENALKKEELYSTLTQDELSEMEDEYYSNIDMLKDISNRFSMNLSFIKIDRLTYIVCIE